MKKIIDARLYDTETAALIGGFSRGGEQKGDYGFVSEEIYRSPGGKLFRYVWGRGMQQFWAGGHARWSGREHIDLMDESEVAEWLEKNSVWLPEGEVEKFVAEFGYPAG